MPAISVAIPAYNYGRFLPAAIASVLGQDYRDVEVIIADDCSTDDTPARVEPFLADPRVRYLRNAHNLGAVRNINKSVAEARGDFVLLLGADDFLLPGSLSALAAALAAHPEAGFAYGNYVFADENDRILDVVRHPGHIPAHLPPWRDDFPALLRFDHYINLGTTLFRREVIEKFGFFDPLLSIDEFPGRFFRATDWDLGLRLSLGGVRSTFVYSPLSAFRVHSSQASSGGEFDRDGIALREFLVLLERYLSDANAGRLAGHELGIYRLLQGKKARFEELAGFLDPGTMELILQRIARAEDYLRRLGATPFDEALPRDGRLSVVVLADDNPRDLLPTLADLAAQSHPDLQVLVVNRGRMDLAGLCRPHRCLHLPGGAPGECRHAGAQLTDGDGLCFVDAGARLPAGHLEALAAALGEAGSLVVQSAWEPLPDTGPTFDPATWQGALSALLPPGHPWRQEVPPLSSFALRRHVYFRSGGFDSGLAVLDDLDFLLRLHRHFPARPLPGRLRSPSLTATMVRAAQASPQPDTIARSLQAIADRLPRDR